MPEVVLLQDAPQQQLPRSFCRPVRGPAGCGRQVAAAEAGLRVRQPCLRHDMRARPVGALTLVFSRINMFFSLFILLPSVLLKK